MIDINNVVGQALSLVDHDLRVNQILVETKCQENLPHINADDTQLQQVILNLIRNAIDAMASAPTSKRDLQLTTRVDGKKSIVSIIVEDTGPGINAEERDRIFKPFFTTKSTGMGLGLSLCRTIVEDHGGHLRLTKTDSSGSIFEITLPFTQETSAPAPSATPGLTAVRRALSGVTPSPLIITSQIVRTPNRRTDGADEQHFGGCAYDFLRQVDAPSAMTETILLICTLGVGMCLAYIFWQHR
jgi:hypothetical protein